jgi:hypothetical protein
MDYAGIIQQGRIWGMMRIDRIAGFGDVWVNEYYRGNYRREQYIDAMNDMFMCKGCHRKKQVRGENVQAAPINLSSSRT